VPNEDAAGLEHAGKFRENLAVICRLGEKPERCKQVEHRAESSGPACRQCPHVAARVSQSRTSAPIAGARQQVARIIQTVDVEAGFGEQVRVATLAARNIEYARTSREPENLDQSRDFVSIALEREEGFVFEKVLAVEIALPPLVPLRTLCHPIKIRSGVAQCSAPTVILVHESQIAKRIAYSFVFNFV